MTLAIQLSAKHPDGRIFVVGGNTYGEFYDNLIAVYGNPDAAERIVEDFVFLLDPSSGQPSQPVAYSAPNANAPAASGPHGASTAAGPPGAPACEHGARTFRSGQGKKGPWTAWFCPQPKGAVQCEAIWG